MSDHLRPASGSELLEIIREVRNRWRLRLALGTAVIVAVGLVLVLLLSASALQALKFSPAAITTFRLVTIATTIGLLAWWLLGPLRRRVTDAQVALYLEECDPSLESAILSAVDAHASESSSHSPALVERL